MRNHSFEKDRKWTLCKARVPARVPARVQARLLARVQAVNAPEVGMADPAQRNPRLVSATTKGLSQDATIASSRASTSAQSLSSAASLPTSSTAPSQRIPMFRARRETGTWSASTLRAKRLPQFKRITSGTTMSTGRTPAKPRAPAREGGPRWRRKPGCFTVPRRKPQLWRYNFWKLTRQAPWLMLQNSCA